MLVSSVEHGLGAGSCMAPRAFAIFRRLSSPSGISCGRSEGKFGLPSVEVSLFQVLISAGDN